MIHWPWSKREKPQRLSLAARIACPSCGKPFDMHLEFGGQQRTPDPLPAGDPVEPRSRDPLKEAAAERAFRARGPMTPLQPPDF